MTSWFSAIIRCFSQNIFTLEIIIVRLLKFGCGKDITWKFIGKSSRNHQLHHTTCKGWVLGFLHWFTPADMLQLPSTYRCAHQIVFGWMIHFLSTDWMLCAAELCVRQITCLVGWSTSNQYFCCLFQLMLNTMLPCFDIFDTKNDRPFLSSLVPQFWAILVCVGWCFRCFNSLFVAA